MVSKMIFEKQKLVLSVGHTSHLLFFLQLKNAGCLEDYECSIILQLQGSFDEKEKIAITAAKQITEDIFIIEKRHFVFYGRNIFKHVVNGYKLKKALRNRYNARSDVLLCHGNTALTTNIIAHFFYNKILFKHYNQYELKNYTLDFGITILVNTINIFLNLKLMKVCSSRRELREIVLINEFLGKIIYYNSIKDVDNVINFSQVSAKRPKENVCLIGVPFLNWEIADSNKYSILGIYKKIIESAHVNDIIYYLRHPNETNLEFEAVNRLTEKQLVDVTHKFISAEHFLLENLNLRLAVSLGSYAVISAYKYKIPTKVFYRDVGFDANIVAEYDQKFKELPDCVHLSVMANYEFNSVSENYSVFHDTINSFSQKDTTNGLEA
jgi:hypothetical protein